MKNSKDTLGDRMKTHYEDAYRQILPKRMPVILRIDGKSFHTYTKGLKRPVDETLIDAMNETAMYLCKEVQGCKLGYVQSDEISLLLVNYQELNTQSWFDNNIQKMVSIAAGLASSYFTSISDRIFGKIKLAQFDARAFVLPKEEVNNYFQWRQNDCVRNSVQMLARSLYSQKQLHGKNNQELQVLCSEKNQNWESCPTSQKRGRCVVKHKFEIMSGDTVVERSKWIIDNEIPIFSQEREYIGKLL